MALGASVTTKRGQQRVDWLGRLSHARALQAEIRRRIFGPAVRRLSPSPALNCHLLNLFALYLMLFTSIHQISAQIQYQQLQDNILYSDQGRNFNHWAHPAAIQHADNIQARSQHIKKLQLMQQLQNIEQHHRPGQDVYQQRHSKDRSIIKILPNGPPPYRPSTLLLGLSSSGALEKLKSTKIFKRMYKSKVYYLFMDVLQQLTILVDKIAKKKIDITGANMAAIQATVNQFALKGGHSLKLKWPLVMLNPHFIKEILSSPTFLVMLFHAIEVAYTSMPAHFWLKPLVKMVKQPSPEKEEKIWWNRKRFYDTLNGHGSSELEPNLKSIHFKNPGKPTPVSIPKLTNIIRQLTGKPPPDPNYYKYPVNNIIHPPSDQFISPYGDQTLMEHSQQQQQTYDLMNLGDANYGNDNELYMTSAQEEAFLANQVHPSSMSSNNFHHDKLYNTPNYGLEESVSSDRDLVSTSESKTSQRNKGVDGRSKANSDHHQSNDQIVIQEAGWLTQMPPKDQLMSQQEFDSLDAHEREVVLREARDRFEESRLTNELIKQQNEFVDSFVNRRDDIIVRPVVINGNHKKPW